MQSYSKLKAKLESGEAVIGVIGLGYVGLPLADALRSGGFGVIGFDVDGSKIEMLAKGENYLPHLGGEIASQLAASERFEGTCDFSRLAEADVAIVCVPTPLGAHHEPDLSYVTQTAEAIGQQLHAGQLIILESTTYPGTTRDILLPTVMRVAFATGIDLTPGEDVFFAYSPEREDPGRASHSTRTIPKLVGGIDKRSTELAVLTYSRALDQVHPVSTAEVAEGAKLLENIFRAVNIALVNEMKKVFTEMKIDIWEVVNAAATKPFGFMPFYPGPGLGGHCIPIDPFYLTWKAREYGCATRFIELAGMINTEMPKYVVDRVVSALNDQGKPAKGARILLLGLSYKPDVSDTRESPSFELIERLRALGAQVDYFDPHIPVAPTVRKYDIQAESVELTAGTVADYDAVLVATAHSDVDYALVAANAQLVVDTRDAMRPFCELLGDRLVRA